MKAGVELVSQFKTAQRPSCHRPELFTPRCPHVLYSRESKVQPTSPPLYRLQGAIGQMRTINSPASRFPEGVESGLLKVELVNVILVKNKGFSEQNIVPLNFEMAQRTRSEGFISSLQSALGQAGCGLNSQIAQILRLP